MPRRETSPEDDWDEPSNDDATAAADDADRDLPQESDLDPYEDGSEAPSDECDRCGREYYGEYCPSCGPEGLPREGPKTWVRLMGLGLVLVFVIAALSWLR